MKIPFEQADLKFNDTLEHLKSEMSAFRIGRGSLSMIEQIKAEVYGQLMPVNQIAAVNMVDSSLVTISPWDKNNLQSIVKAIQISNLGINPTIDQNLVRLPIPPLTEERRKEYIKLMHQKLEDAKLTVRQIRKDIIDDLEEKKKAGDMGEDDFDRKEKDLQKKVENTNLKIEQLGKEKEKEILQV
jgi:ribosome recycling factor